MMFQTQFSLATATLSKPAHCESVSMAGFLAWALRECFCRKVFGLDSLDLAL